MSEIDSGPGSRPNTEVVRKVDITPRLVYAILGPYFAGKIVDQVRSVLPISAFLFLFQLLVIRRGVTDSIEITMGLTAVVLGLMFFMEGLRLGLMPLGTVIGSTLPAKAGLRLILGFAFVVGIGATYAEPAISTLKAAGGNVQPGESALLYQMLNGSSALLVASVGIGVGIATALGVLRFVRQWSLKLLLLPTLATALTLTILAELNADTRDITALAWDTGAVTTGPVTVPLVLALGIGVSTVLGKSDTGMSGFGIVTLASLWPVIMVLLASFFVYATGTMPGATDGVLNAAGTTAAEGETLTELIATSIRAALQAIVPLVLLLYVVQRFVLKEDVRHLDQVMLGVVFALIGLLLFSIGLGRGLIPLGEQVGSNVPAAFAPPDALYGETGGRIVAMTFAFVLGYGATLAEPALNALGVTVEEVTAGAFKKTLLMQAVAVGVGAGLATGIAKIIFDVPITYLVVPCYAVLVLVTVFSDEKYVNIGWDSAGVTTGPITVPLVLAMGLGVGGAVGVADGFGMLAMASIGPIMSVLTLGLIASRRSRQSPSITAAAGSTVTTTG